MIEWIAELTPLQKAELFGLYLSGFGALSAAIVAAWIATRQSRRRLAISQSFFESHDEQYVIPERKQQAELLVTNIGNQPVSLQSIILHMPNNYIGLTSSDVVNTVDFPVFLGVGHTAQFEFEKADQETWPVARILQDIKGWPLWIVWIALRMSAQWRFRLVTGEIFRQHISSGLRDVVWQQAKMRKRGEA